MSPYVNEVTELPRDPLGGASGEKRRFRVDFIGKTNNQLFPYTVANEVVAMHIGVALGLNVPTVLTHRFGNEDCVLVQLVDRDPSMQQEPPATAAALEKYVVENPREVHGAIVFDLFLANNDRAFGPIRRNLLLDRSGRLLLYDNGNCCFYRNRPHAGVAAGTARLDAVEADLNALFDMDQKGNHYFEFLTDWGMVREWCDRICALPEFLIENAVARIPVNSVNKKEQNRLSTFLQMRREYLYEHIARNRHRFPKLPETGG